MLRVSSLEVAWHPLFIPIRFCHIIFATIDLWNSDTNKQGYRWMRLRHSPKLLLFLLISYLSTSFIHTTNTTKCLSQISLQRLIHNKLHHLFILLRFCHIISATIALWNSCTNKQGYRRMRLKYSTHTITSLSNKLHPLFIRLRFCHTIFATIKYVRWQHK